MVELMPEDDPRVKAMVDVAWKENFSAGTDIITEGDLVADYFYIVQEGVVEISVSNTDPEGEAEKSMEEQLKGGTNFVTTISKGGSFGELALLYLVPRAATVKSKTDSVLWVIDRINFKEIMMKVSAQKIDEYITYLNRVALLDPLTNEEKKAIAQALIEMHFAKGEVILQEGEQGNTFYIHDRLAFWCVIFP